MPNIKTAGQRNLKLLGGQAPFSQGPCVLPLTQWPQNQLRSSTNHDIPPCKIWRLWVKEISSYWATSFFNQGPCDFDLWPSDLKINRGHLLIMTNLHVKYEDCGSKESQGIGRKSFLKSRRCDLDLWPSDLKINRGYLLIMTNLHAKYEHCGSKESQVNGQTSY
jgi:hypothetical protein